MLFLSPLGLTFALGIVKKHDAFPSENRIGGIYAVVAQLVEQGFRKAKVGSSSLFNGTIKKRPYGAFFLWLNCGKDLKTRHQR